MTLKVTAENAKGIASVFNVWKDKLPSVLQALVDDHISTLMQLNERSGKSPCLGEQSRAVCLAYFYLFYLEHYIEGRPIAKMVDEI